MPKKYHMRAPNAHAIKTGEIYKTLSKQHPHMDHRQVFAMASKEASGKGLHLHPYGGYIHPRNILANLLKRR